MCEGGDEMDQNFDATLAKQREGDDEEKKQVLESLPAFDNS